MKRLHLRGLYLSLHHSAHRDVCRLYRVLYPRYLFRHLRHHSLEECRSHAPSVLIPYHDLSTLVEIRTSPLFCVVSWSHTFVYRTRRLPRTPTDMSMPPRLPHIDSAPLFPVPDTSSDTFAWKPPPPSVASNGIARQLSGRPPAAMPSPMTSYNGSTNSGSSMGINGDNSSAYESSLGRTSSAMSGASGAVSLDRPMSRATSSSMSAYTTDIDATTRRTPSSSLATTVDRGNSYRSDNLNGWETGTSTSTFQQYSQIPPPPTPNGYLQSGPSSHPMMDGMQIASSSRSWRGNEAVRPLEDIKRPLELHGEYLGEGDEYYYDDDDPEDEEGDDRFFNPALLSHIAVRLRDKVPRGTHVKGSIPYPRAFTGKDIVVSAIHFSLVRYLTQPIVNDSIPNTTRASHHTWNFHE